MVRGYHSRRWDLRPTSELCHCAAGFGKLSDVGDFFHHHHAVGSLVHLHLAALPQVVAAFAGPHRPSLTLAAGQSVILRRGPGRRAMQARPLARSACLALLGPSHEIEQVGRWSPDPAFPGRAGMAR